MDSHFDTLVETGDPGEKPPPLAEVTFRGGCQDVVTTQNTGHSALHSSERLRHCIYRYSRRNSLYSRTASCLTSCSSSSLASGSSWLPLLRWRSRSSYSTVGRLGFSVLACCPPASAAAAGWAPAPTARQQALPQAFLHHGHRTGNSRDCSFG